MDGDPQQDRFQSAGLRDPLQNLLEPGLHGRIRLADAIALIGQDARWQDHHRIVASCPIPGIGDIRTVVPPGVGLQIQGAVVRHEKSQPRLLGLKLRAKDSQGGLGLGAGDLIQPFSARLQVGPHGLGNQGQAKAT